MIIMLTVIMMIVGTVYDVTVYQKILENKNIFRINNNDGNI